MIGLAYLVCVLILSLLVGLASKERHSAPNGADIFRFPRILITTLRICSFVPGMLGIGIYFSFPNPGFIEAAVLAGLFGSMTVIVLVSLLQTSSFSLQMGLKKMELYELGKRRTFYFSDVRKMRIVWPWRGRGSLELFGEDGKVICRIDGGIQDFDEFASLVESRCPSGTAIKEKDTEGKWTDRFS